MHNTVSLKTAFAVLPFVLFSHFDSVWLCSLTHQQESVRAMKKDDMKDKESIVGPNIVHTVDSTNNFFFSNDA